MLPVRIIEPSLDLLDRYAAALRHGFEPAGDAVSSLAELRAIEADPRAYVRAHLDQRPPAAVAASAGPLRLERWIFDVVGCDFVGMVTFHAVPPLVSQRVSRGRIHLAVATWWRHRGYEARALDLVLAIVRGTEVAAVDVACEVDDLAFRRVIEGHAAGRVAAATLRADERGRLVYRVPLGARPRVRDAA